MAVCWITFKYAYGELLVSYVTCLRWCRFGTGPRWSFVCTAYGTCSNRTQVSFVPVWHQQLPPFPATAFQYSSDASEGAYSGSSSVSSSNSLRFRFLDFFDVFDFFGMPVFFALVPVDLIVFGGGIQFFHSSWTWRANSRSYPMGFIAQTSMTW